MWSGSRLGGSALGADLRALALVGVDAGIPTLGAIRGPAVDAGGTVAGRGATALADATVPPALDAAEASAEGDGGGTSGARTSLWAAVRVGGAGGKLDGGDSGFDAADIARVSDAVLEVFSTKPAAARPTTTAIEATTRVSLRRGAPSVFRFATGLDVVVATSLAAARTPCRAWGDSGAVPNAVATLATFLGAGACGASRGPGSVRALSISRGACSRHALRCSWAIAPKSSA